ncbi:MAG: cation:proton antiporter [Acidobacteria bacterium]|jgi:Kef-type K+ transport system membrane component KefB|nr:cation:proton antiporter [Acidobacteriota bacterium]
MDELTSLGLILLLALLAGHLVRALRIPEVTGYLLAGVVLGPSVLGWLSQDNLSALGVVSEVALGLILFSVGSVFESSLFRRIGRQVVQLTLVESALAAAVVATGMLVLGQSWQIAFLLGAVAMATAPASTLMVVRECNSAGPVTDYLLGVIAVNNVLCITVYSLVAAGIDLTSPASSSFFWTLYRSAFTFAWQMVGSAALGFLLGLLLAKWSAQVTEGGEMLILLAGSILLCVGVARGLDLSPLVASLAVGATMVNLTERSRHLFETLAGTDPPFYAMFFVLAGAQLDVSLVPTMGVLGVVYVLGRAGGKFIGARVAAKRLGLEQSVQRLLGFALMAQAGLAVGLTFAINDRFPAIAPVITTVVLGSVAVYEIFGPISTRFALVRAGEAQKAKPSARDPIKM